MPILLSSGGTILYDATWVHREFLEEMSPVTHRAVHSFFVVVVPVSPLFPNKLLAPNILSLFLWKPN